MSFRLRFPAFLAVLACVLLGATASAQAAMDAHGSARQVYATGLKPKAKAKLLDAKGRTVKTKKVSSLGSLLFRSVKPGSGYRVSAGGGEKGPPPALSDQP